MFEIPSTRINPMLFPGLFKVPSLKPKDINDIVSNQFNIETSDIYIDTRKHSIVLARQLCMVLRSSVYPSISLSDIALHYRRGHCSLIHARNVINNILTTKTTPDDYNRITKSISEFHLHYPQCDMSRLPWDYTGN